MKFLFIIRYRMRSGKDFCTAAYAGSWPEALKNFNRRMGQFGCEFEQYMVISHRAIKENWVQFPQHLGHLARLTEEDRREFFVGSQDPPTQTSGEFRQIHV